MNELVSAINILTQAQRLLQSRLAERIEEWSELILADAAEGHYSGEIDTLNDQLGSKLLQVNQMLAALSQGAEPPPLANDERPDQSDESGESVARANMETFLAQAEALELSQAANSLSEMLAVDERRGLQCAAHFVRKCRDDQDVFDQARKLESHVAENRTNDGIQSLHACFGLTGTNLITAFETFKIRLDAA